MAGPASLGEMLRIAVSNGVTQKQIADECDLTPSSINQWLHEKVIPEPENIPGIARATGQPEVTVATLRWRDLVQREDRRHARELEALDREADRILATYGVRPELPSRRRAKNGRQR